MSDELAAALAHSPLRLAATALLLTAAFEIGYRLARRRRDKIRKEVQGHSMTVAGIMLGMMGMLLAFSLGTSGGHFQARKELVVREANAITTTWLRAEALPEPYRTHSRELLADYVAVRLRAVQTGDLEEGLERSREVQRELWHAAVAGARQPEIPGLLGLYVGSLNSVFELHQDREAVALWQRTPETLLWTLFGATTVSVLLLGFSLGLTGTRSTVGTAALIVTLTWMLAVIVDLDRPRQRLFEVGQQALVEVQQRMEASRPPS